MLWSIPVVFPTQCDDLPLYTVGVISLEVEYMWCLTIIKAAYLLFFLVTLFVDHVTCFAIVYFIVSVHWQGSSLPRKIQPHRGPGVWGADHSMSRGDSEWCLPGIWGAGHSMSKGESELCLHWKKLVCFSNLVNQTPCFAIADQRNFPFSDC